MAQGVGFSIDASFLNKIEQADKALKKLADTNDTVVENISNTWKQIGKQGLDSYLRSLEKQKNVLADIASIKFDDSAPYYLKKFGENAKSSVAEIDKLIQTLTTLQQANPKQLAFEKAMMQIQSTEQNRQIKQNAEDVTRAFQERVKVWEEGFRRVEEKEKQLATNAVKSAQDFAKQMINIFDQINKANPLKQSSTQLISGNTDYQRYIQQQLDVELESYRKNKEQKAKAEKEAHDKRKKDIEEAIRSEQKADEDAYQLWLMRKHNEAKEHKRVEDEKVRATIDAINKQNQEYQRQTQIKQQASQQSSIAKSGSANAQAEWEARMKVWEEGFRRQEQKELEAYNKWLELKHKETQKHKEAEEAKTKATIEAIDRQNKAMASFIVNQQRRQRALYNATGDSSQGALKYANRLFGGAKPMTLNNMQTALAKLQDAQRKLNLDTEEGRKKYDSLQAAIDKVNKKMQEVTNSSKQINESHRSLINTGDQLMRKFALIFSVSQIQGYINKLAQVRGEFELQQRALQSILQNKAEANKIWQQTVDLAVRSPFRVGELVKYTKQLAAYRIETDKLHETTKRLADVSAGLGVDMSRLILAFGQVRAAEYLRGTELRQFTEAGIPLLEELAERFTALRGETVSTAEVFGMISKRMVSFEDVAAVFQKMTDAGGVFYNMQEIQAETLKGQISNLHDSIDLMLNDIGKANEGVLKGMVSTAKYFVDNWDKVLVFAQGIIAAFIGVKLHSLACRTSLIHTAASMGIVSGAGVKQLTSLQLLQVGWKKLTASIATATGSMQGFLAFNAPLLAVTALVGGVMELVSTIEEHRKQLFEINKKYDELASKANKVTVNFGNAVRNKDFDKQKEALMQLVKIANNDYNMGIDIELRGLSEEEVESKFTNLRNQLQQMKAFRQEFSTKLQETTEITLQDDIQEDLAQYGAAATQLMDKMYNNSADIIVELRKNFDSLTESEQAALTELEKPRDINESELKYLERIQSAYTTLMGKYQMYYDQYEKTRVTGNHHEVLSLLAAEDKRLASMGINAKALAGYFSEYNNKLIEAKEEIEKFYDTVDINESISVEEKTLQIKTAIDEQGWNSFTTELAYRLANKKWKVNIGFSLKDPDALDHWQDEYNKFVEGFSTQVTRANKKSDRFDLAKQLSDLWQDKNKVIKAYENGAKEITKTEYESAKKIADELNKSHIWLIGEAIKGKGKKDREGKDWWLEMVKGIQSLHKEFLILNKDLDDTAAKTLAIDKHKKLFEEIKSHLGASASAINIDEIDFTNENAFKDFLRGLKEIKGLSAEARLAIEKALTNIEGEATINIAIDETDSIKRAISDMFGSYELSLELQKLNIPPDLAKQLFGVESLDLSSLRNKILDKAGLSSLKGKSNEEIYDSGAFKKLSEERQKAVKDGLEKEEELERKAQEERLKKYVKYLQKAQSEAVRIKINELNQLDEIEKTFQLKENVATSKDFGMTKEQWSKYNKLVETKKEINEENLKSIGLSDELIAKVIKYNNQMKISADLARKGVRKETEDKLNENQWKLFKESSPYKLAFSDIESQSTATLSVIENGIKSVKDSLSKLDITQMKELADLEQKVFDIKVSRNPFKELETSLKTIQDLKSKGKTKDTLLNQIVGSEEQIAKAQHKIDLIDIALSKGRAGASAIDAKYLAEYHALLLKTPKQMRDLRTEQEGVITNNKKTKATAEQNLDTYSKADQAAKEAFAQAQQATEMLQKAYGDLSSVLSAVGVEMESSDNAVQNIGFGLLDLGMQIAQIAIQAQIMGVAFKTAMGPIGWISIALTAVATVLTGIFAAHDKGLERQIQNNIKMVEQLERAYQRLEKRIEDAYSVGNIQTNYELAKKNLIQQQEAYANMIEMEEAKKKTDKDKIREWKNELEDLTQQRQELEEQRLADLGGFGSQANYKSAAEEFANAWFDAYQEVGDGMGALEDTFDDFINNVVKKQLLIKGSNKLLQPVLDMIDKAVSDGEVTTQEMAEVNRKWNEDTKDALNSYYKSIYDMYDGLINGAGELSDLQRGIQNITEPQAAAIEAYLNSLRFFVSDSNRVLKEIQQQMSVGVNNPMVSELKAQTQLIRTIDENLSSVIGRGSSSHTGAYIKVLAK